MARGESALEFKVKGLDCAEEVIALRRELAPLVGEEELLSFDILNGKMTVASAARLSREAIVAAVARMGMRAEPWSDAPQARADGARAVLSGRFALAVTSGLAALAGLAAHAASAGSLRAALGSEGLAEAYEVPLAAKLAYAIAVLAGGWLVFPKAWGALMRRRPDMNLLMTIAVLGALGIGEWFEAATVSFLFAIALLLETWSIARARRSVAALLELAPPTARVLRPDGNEAEVPAREVAVGTRFVVKPGERIPLDGRVAAGSSAVDQAPITGESTPVLKEPEDEVFAGTINGDGALEIDSTKAPADTLLARITQLVGDAHARRAPSERWVEKFARVYTPAVMGLALGVLVVPPLALGGAWSAWLYRALVLLVIACPCALVISTPVSIVAALAAAARNGVLIKGGAHVESPARIKAMAFDKTGTLSAGAPAVVALEPLSGHSAEEVLQAAAALEARSDHPLARAILAFAREQGTSVVPAQDFTALPGKGASGHVLGEIYWLGSHRYLEERGQETDTVHQRLDALSRAGRTVVIVGREDHVCGFIALADPMRQETPATIAELRSLGIEHMVMLTGDNRATAEALAASSGLDETRAELLPPGKVAAVEELVERYHAVAMVGDGVNDAPAMARATLGIAMGAAGSDAAIEAADIALMADDLSKLPWLVRHSRRTLRVVRQNIVFSLAVKAIFVTLTLAGHASLWSAIAADMGASLIVIFNALRLLGSSRASSIEASVQQAAR